MIYTGIYKGFQIRDCQYLCEPPKNIPLRFNIVKWYNHDPYEVTNIETGEKTTSTESCYSVANLEYNEKESCFELISVGLRWLECHPDEDVENWLIKWCEYKLQELEEN